MLRKDGSSESYYSSLIQLQMVPISLDNPNTVMLLSEDCEFFK